MELICYTVMGVFPAVVILSMVSVYHSGVCHQSLVFYHFLIQTH